MAGMPEGHQLPVPYGRVPDDLPREAAIAAFAAARHDVITAAELRVRAELVDGCQVGAARAPVPAAPRRVRGGSLRARFRGPGLRGRPGVWAEGGCLAPIGRGSRRSCWPTTAGVVDVTVPGTCAASRRGIVRHASLTLTLPISPWSTASRARRSRARSWTWRTRSRGVSPSAPWIRPRCWASSTCPRRWRRLERAGRRHGAAVIRELLVGVRRAHPHAQRARGALPRPLPERRPCPAGRERLGSNARRRRSRSTSSGAGRSSWSRPTGARFHATAAALRARPPARPRLKLAGYEPIRFTWRELVEEPARSARSRAGHAR